LQFLPAQPILGMDENLSKLLEGLKLEHLVALHYVTYFRFCARHHVFILYGPSDGVITAAASLQQITTASASLLSLHRALAKASAAKGARRLSL